MRTCEVCQTELTGHRKRFCSHECRDISMQKRIECTCIVCGKVHYRPEWEVNGGKGRYCSSDCFHKAQIGISRPSRMRREVTYCEVCGKEYIHGGRLKRSRFCSVECRYAGRYRRGKIAAKLSDTDAAYLAGFVDGEGSIMIPDDRKTISTRLSIVNTCQSVMDWIKQVTNAGFVNQHGRKNSKHKDVFMWVVNGDTAYSVIEQIMPYLKVKKAQAELALEVQQRLRVPAIKADTSWYAEYVQRMKALNKRGRADEIPT